MSSNPRRRSRHWALAAAVTAGAGVACAYALTTGLAPATSSRASQPQPAPAAQQASADGGTASSAPPPVTPKFGFTAKIVSDDIPTADGGVRSGGCSGALIAPRWILTAGHCFHDLAHNPVRGRLDHVTTVTVGRQKDTDPGGQTRRIVEVRQSPVNDIAVARLSDAVTGIAPLELNTEPLTVGQELEFGGWGAHSPAGDRSSTYLKQGRFAIAAVREHMAEAKPLQQRTVHNSPCPRDSGSPFFTSDDGHHGTVYAVESSGPPCPQPGLESVSRVDVAADWIRAQVG